MVFRPTAARTALPSPSLALRPLPFASPSSSAYRPTLRPPRRHLASSSALGDNRKRFGLTPPPRPPPKSDLEKRPLQSSPPSTSTPPHAPSGGPPHLSRPSTTPSGVPPKPTSTASSPPSPVRTLSGSSTQRAAPKTTLLALAYIPDIKKLNSAPVPPLPRPLGVNAPPVAAGRDWDREVEGEERRQMKRQALLRDAADGYFHGISRTRGSNKGKLWVAPKVLIREDAAKYFPNIVGRTLTAKHANTTELLRGKTSLVVIHTNEFGHAQVKNFTEPVTNDQKMNPAFQIVEINHQPNPLKALLLSFVENTMKRSVPEYRWDRYLIAKGGWSDVDINFPLGIYNHILGYAFLVDSRCKIRWAAVGDPVEHEMQSLREATGVLLARMIKDPKAELVGGAPPKGNSSASLPAARQALVA